MITQTIRIISLGTAVATVAATSAFAQRQLSQPNNPTSKIYLAETQGDAQIQTGDKIYSARQATTFDAPGTIIETKENAHSAFVYSNGTGLYLDQNTRVEIERFQQEAFRPDRNTTDRLLEPSVSQSDVHVTRGVIAICTSRLISGSSMAYTTPHAVINIRGGRVAVDVKADETIVDLLEGDITVHAGIKDIGGQILRPGERITVKAAVAGDAPTVEIGETPRELVSSLENRIAIACSARKTVSFEAVDTASGDGLDIGGGGGDNQTIVAKPAVPEQLPSNIVVSPDRLPGG
jgi:hypothetical protein